MAEQYVTLDLQPFMDRLDQLQRVQVPFAASLALNNTAFLVMQEMNTSTTKYFENPVPFTQKGFNYSKSTKRDLVAEVFPEARRARYLNVEISGGNRELKKYERFFTALSSYKLDEVVPVKDILDGRGNPRKGIFKSIEDGLSNKSGTGYFIGTPRGRRPGGRGGVPGVYRRGTLTPLRKPGRPVGSKNGVRNPSVRILTPLFQVLSRPQYNPLFPFYDIGQSTVSAVWQTEFDKAFARAIS